MMNPHDPPVSPDYQDDEEMLTGRDNEDIETECWYYEDDDAYEEDVVHAAEMDVVMFHLLFPPG